MSLHVERAGRGRDLVLLHGWAMHSGAWSDVMPELARHYRVHAVDLPGHGHSAHVPPGSFDGAVRQLDELSPEDSILCGWSLGGLIAQRLAALEPRRFRALVLVASTPCFAERADWPHAMPAATLDEFARGLREDHRATLRRFVRLNAMHGERGREAIRAMESCLEERTPAPVEALEATLSWLRETDLRPSAASLAVECRVVHGGRDTIAPVEAGRWLSRAIPGARLYEIPQAAHLPFFTHRPAFLRAFEGLDG